MYRPPSGSIDERHTELWTAVSVWVMDCPDVRHSDAYMALLRPHTLFQLYHIAWLVQLSLAAPLRLSDGFSSLAHDLHPLHKRGQRIEQAKILVYALGWPFFLVLGLLLAFLLISLVCCCCLCSRTRQRDSARRELQDLKERMERGIVAQNKMAQQRESYDAEYQ